MGPNAENSLVGFSTTWSVPFWNCTLGELPNSKNMLMSVISRLGACGGREKREERSFKTTRPKTILKAVGNRRKERREMWRERRVGRK